MSLLPRIAEASIFQNADDVFNDITVMESDNMVVARTQRIATRYVRDNTKAGILWVIRELSYNSDDDVIMVKTFPSVSTKPDWIPDALGAD